MFALLLSNNDLQEPQFWSWLAKKAQVTLPTHMSGIEFQSMPIQCCAGNLRKTNENENGDAVVRGW